MANKVYLLLPGNSIHKFKKEKHTHTHTKHKALSTNPPTSLKSVISLPVVRAYATDQYNLKVWEVILFFLADCVMSFLWAATEERLSISCGSQGGLSDADVLRDGWQSQRHIFSEFLEVSF